jgi:hypothetical protein
MKGLATVAVAIALGGATSAAAADDPVTGAWKVNGHVDGKDFVVHCRFDRHGDGFGGVCLDSSKDPKRTLTFGSLKGEQIKWIYQSHWGLIKFDVTYVGKLTGAGMAGAVGTAGHNGTFTGTRE